MAQKRMFDKAIIDTDQFMDLSMTAKAFYFLLGMEADDEGFVSYKKVMRVHGGNEDDMKILVVKGFLISFPSGVVVITDWNTNNWLDSRRIRETEYQKEKKCISLTKNNKYVLSHGLALAKTEESSIEENRSETDVSPSSEKSVTTLEEFLTSKGYTKLEFYNDGDVQDKWTQNGKRPVSDSQMKILEREWHRATGTRIAPVARNEVEMVFAMFKDLNPAYGSFRNNKTQRQAANDLLDLYTLKQIEVLLNMYRKIPRDTFKVKITNPWELLNKIPKIKLDDKPSGGLAGQIKL